MDEDILELVSQFDQAFEADMLADADVDEDCERPKTADTEVNKVISTRARGIDGNLIYINPLMHVIQT